MKEALVASDIAPDRIHVLYRNGSELDDSGHCRRLVRTPHLPGRTTPILVRWYLLREAWYCGALEGFSLSKHFLSWPSHATSLCAGRAGREFVTTVRADWSRAQSPDQPLEKPADGNLHLLLATGR